MSENLSKPWFHMVPNILTVFRGVLALIIPFLILSPNPWHHRLGDLLFFIGAWTDYFDGKLARRYNLISEFGKFVDPLTDKLLILLPLWALTRLGLFSVWFIVLIYAREILITFIRTGWMIEKQVIAAEKLGKWKFGLQVASVGFPLLYILSTEVNIIGFLSPVLYLLIFVSLIIANILTILSASDLFIKNLKLFESTKFAEYVGAMGVGLFPIAPGTWGSFFTVCLLPLLVWNVGLYLGAFALFVWAGYWACSRIDLSRNKDPGFIVLDEAVGILVTFAFIPLNWTTAVVGFLLFRVFDILKPFPCKKLEKYPGYTGILMDDIGAGIYAWIILFLFFR